MKELLFLVPVVGLAGGPTAVINSSLAGVFKTAKDRGANKRKVFSLKVQCPGHF